jgi:multiple sugar transport system permease protein
MRAERTGRRVGRQEWLNIVKGALFIGPWFVGFLLFTVYPILASAYYSFTRYDIIRQPIFVGLANYGEILFTDDMFRVVLANTLYMVVIGVPVSLAVAFCIAALLNAKMRFRSVFRTIFFLPSIVPVVATVMVWLWIYNPRYGLINSFLASVGLQAIPWLSSPILAKPSLIIIQAWAQGSAIVIFLAALQDVPSSLYDAATVDGANRWQQFWHVTAPMCTPAILFNLLIGLIATFQSFTLPWLLTGGGPNMATEFYGLYLYRNAFLFFRMGYASALAWLLFVIIVVVTVIIFRTSARWVYYGGETK